MRIQRSLAALLASASLTVAVLAANGGTAHADRKSLLDGQPAVRHRLLLVKGRFELTPLFESSINADFRHTIGGGLKAEYHVSDMLSFGAVGVFSTGINTGLVNRILDTLEDSYPDGDPTPTAEEYEQHLNKMPLHGAAYLSVTPWYGKLAAFGKAFVNFDFYFQAGVSFAKLESDCDDSICDDPAPGVIDPEMGLVPDDDPNNDPPLNDGQKIGLYLGGGIHVFMTEAIALDFTVRDYLFSDNPSGLDFDADLAVTDDDTRFLNHLFMGVGVSVLLPFKAKRTP
jgi:outer membrane beta-barrel protein